MTGEIALKAIEEGRAKFEDLSYHLWANPEPAYREYIASETCIKALEEAGFAIEKAVGGVPTAFKATYGSGSPVIALLAEYDALPGLSQKAVSHKEPVEGQSCGHGCGHCLMAGANVAAAVGIKAEMEAKNLPGTLIFLGCPAEEQLTGKVFMARGHAFDGLDIALSYHPLFTTEVSVGNSSAMNTAKFHFKGRTAHAGGDPHNGRSALDAVELMNVGANYLREHVTSDVRIHYTITEGGTAPNIVPDKACVWYYVRAMRREAVEDVYARLVKVAKGAAMMTETEVEIEFLGGCYNTMANMVLSELVHKNMGAVPQDPWTPEEIQMAREMSEASGQNWENVRRAYNLGENDTLSSTVQPMKFIDQYGSTDVGDVMHLVPTAMFFTASFPMGAPGHSWQNTASAGSSIGHKGMIYGARILAKTVLDCFENPDIVKAAKEEFDKATAGSKYLCPIPDEVPVP